MLKDVYVKKMGIFGRKRYGYRMKFFFFIPLLINCYRSKEQASSLFARLPQFSFAATKSFPILFS
jgi:hypothetical protein